MVGKRNDSVAFGIDIGAALRRVRAHVKGASPWDPVHHNDNDDDGDGGSDIGAGGVDAEERAAVRAAERAMVRTTITTSVMHTTSEATVGPLAEGHARVRKVRWALQQFKLQYTELQTEFHDMMLFTYLPQLYGNAWDLHEAEILAYYGRDAHKPRVAMSMPRSGGKTAAIVTFLAAFAYTMVDQRLLLVCFSIAHDQSSWVMDKTYQHICMLPGGAKMCHKSASLLLISRKPRHLASSTATVLRSQSGNVEGGRGLQPDGIILEEAAYIVRELYLRTVFPMFNHRKRSVIAISSPSDANGFFASLFTLRFPDSGELVFESVKDENICPDCLKAGRMDCSHKIKMNPPWKSKSFCEV